MVTSFGQSHDYNVWTTTNSNMSYLMTHCQCQTILNPMHTYLYVIAQTGQVPIAT